MGVEDASATPEEAAFTRYARADIDELVKNKFKTFCKEKCAECSKPATKRFSSSMSVIVAALVDSFWCRDCGRVLCEAHRHQHTCELIDQQKERNSKISHEQLAAQIAEAEARKEATEEAARVEARKLADIEEQERLVRKGRRELMAKKAKYVEDFLQGVLRDGEGPAGRPGAARDELWEMYPQSKRIALSLFNEFEHPSNKELPEEDYKDIKEIYERTKELSGIFVVVEGVPLDMRNSWDPPPPADEAALGADGGALGRGEL